MKEIRINAPGAGDWIMSRCEGRFRDDMDQSIANYRSGEIVGGFVLCQYMGASIAVHMAGSDPRWCSRDLMWMLFHYAFRQLKVHKMFAPVASDNVLSLSLNMRAGWTVETIVHDVYAPGRHMMVLTMTPETCRWLAVRPKQQFTGHNVEAPHGR